MRTYVRYFLNGLLFVTPIALTFYVCWRLFRFIDGWLRLPVPGAGFLLTVVFITLVGFLASNLIARSAFAWLERLLTRLPFVRMLYTSIRDVLGAVVGEKRRFDKPVLVTLVPGSEAKALGFLTQDALDGLGIPGHVAVYLPQSYNFAGQTLIFPAERVQPLEANSGAVMAFIVSGGVTGTAGSSPSSARDRGAGADEATP
ncbi:MAG TPA: DUF502 domain-containing protein [Gemmatimonadales bacterium]|nr:DUF502 domain-containing protein [Gemmatimonadales bacterium]